MTVVTGDSSKNWMAIVSLILGIISFCGGGYSIIIPIIGAVLGYLGRGSSQRTMALIGLILNIVSLVIYLIIWIFFGGLAVLSAFQ